MHKLPVLIGILILCGCSSLVPPDTLGFGERGVIIEAQTELPTDVYVNNEHKGTLIPHKQFLIRQEWHDTSELNIALVIHKGNETKTIPFTCAGEKRWLADNPTKIVCVLAENGELKFKK